MPTRNVASASSSGEHTFPCELTVRVPFPSGRLARIARRSLDVDQELSAFVRREFSVVSVHQDSSVAQQDSLADSVLVAHYSATTNRMLRVAVNGFFENLAVVLDCMRELDGEGWADEWVGTKEAFAGADAGDVRELRKVQGLEEKGLISAS